MAKKPQKAASPTQEVVNPHRQQYSYRAGMRISGVSAQAVGIELARIENEQGLTPANVLAEAESPASALHGGFEWDDTKAAHAHRLDQARRLIGCIVVNRIGGERTNGVRAFISVSRADRREYVSLARAKSDRELRKEIVRRALAELRTFQDKYSILKELSDVWGGLSRAQRSLENHAIGLDGENAEELEDIDLDA